MTTQQQPVEASPDTEASTKTVHVVAANLMDDPHPHVLGVYDNEEAAEEHEKQIKNNHFMWDGQCVASFWSYEVAVESEVGADGM